MANIEISEEELKDRGKSLCSRLKRCLPDKPFIFSALQSININTVALAIYQGQKRDLSYKNWRINIGCFKIAISYYEIWQRQRSNRRYCYLLNKAYLHVYLPHPTENEKDLIHLHCDPQEPEDSEHYRFKVAPHLHFEIAGDPWKNAHIPLCDGWQQMVLENISSLDDAIVRAIDFLVYQICPLTRNYKSS